MLQAAPVYFSNDHRVKHHEVRQHLSGVIQLVTLLLSSLLLIDLHLAQLFFKFFYFGLQSPISQINLEVAIFVENFESDDGVDAHT